MYYEKIKRGRTGYFLVHAQVCITVLKKLISVFPMLQMTDDQDVLRILYHL